MTARDSGTAGAVGGTDAQAEDAVRRYLAYRRAPGEPFDAEIVAELTERLADERDPERRRQMEEALAELTPDEESLEAQFVEHARTFAQATGLTADAFEVEGVPRSVLERAGLLAPPSRRPRTRRRDVGAVDVREHVERTRAPFTVAEVAERTGASQATVRSVVRAMEQTGALVRSDAGSRGRRGRPQKFTRVPKSRRRRDGDGGG